MVRKRYIPDRGDIVWLQFTPQLGHEQMGRRPAITLSPKSYNKKVGFALFCPITSKAKGYPFEVTIQGKIINGVTLSDQVKSLDWRKRDAEFIQKAPPAVLAETTAKVKAIIE